jgi:penicillin amidase
MTSANSDLIDSLTAEIPTQRRGIKWLKRTLFGLLSFIVVVAVAGALFLVWTVQRSFPQVSGELEVAGLKEVVTVQRDALGIPTVTASNTHDLFFAQGFVHAQDRFWEMDFRRHVTSARVSELFGESQLGTDAFLRTLGWHRVAQEEVKLLEPEVLAYYEAYAAGVNAYLAQRSGAELSLEYAVLGLTNAGYEPEPWTPADSIAWLKAMAWDLRTNIEEETTRALLAAQLGSGAEAVLEQLYPDYPFDRNAVIAPELSGLSSLPPQEEAEGEAKPALSTQRDDDPEEILASVPWQDLNSVLASVSELLGGVGEGIGSNSWVVSGALTDTGMPLLANDPHLGASLPSVWHQMQLRCAPVSEDCAFNVAGFTFSGLPGVVIGHNDRVAWGFTNLTTDVADLYLEKIEGNSYWYDGELLPLETRQETLRVAGGDDVVITVQSTIHGPIISGLTSDFTQIAENPYLNGAEDALASEPGGEYAVALRWTALDAGTTASAIFELNLAQDFHDFRRAASLFNVPAQNLIYADVDGNIGYQTPGLLPIRGAGDGWLPQPGWDSSYDWKGFIPFDELPMVYNPTSGYIVTANNAIVDESYPYFLSRDWDYGYRAQRIVTLLERKIATGSVSAQDMRDIQADNEMWIGKRLAMLMSEVKSNRPEVFAATELLRNWDAQASADSAAAAYANVLWSQLVHHLFNELEVPLPMSSHSRLYTVVDKLLDNPEDPLWTNQQTGAKGLSDTLRLAAEAAYDELSKVQGSNMSRWDWGKLHAIPLVSDTFGSSGIAPIEWLFNRGPYRTGGGASVVNATGWTVGEGYATVTVPSMRMVIDVADFDRSSWNHLTGTSGHAFHENYVDQVDNWSKALQSPWPFSTDAVAAATTNTLTLVPAK